MNGKIQTRKIHIRNNNHNSVVRYDLPTDSDCIPGDVFGALCGQLCSADMCQCRAMSVDIIFNGALVDWELCSSDDGLTAYIQLFGVVRYRVVK